MPRFDHVIGQPPRFALATPRFRFRALAAFAGRASIGGDREIALACLVVGRLAAAMLPPLSLSATDTKTRSSAAKQWMASLSLPAVIRTALIQVADAVVLGNRIATSGAIERLVSAVQGRIDEAGAGELLTLAGDLNPLMAEAGTS
jgi:hypothetical protein